MTNHNDDWLLYNASEYKVNGKTYRNLEAEVLYNHRLSEQNAADIDALEGRMDTAEGDIDALEGRMDTAEGDIDALEGRMDAAEGDIDALEGRMDTAEGDIDALEDISPYSVIYNAVTGVCDKTMGEIIAAKSSGRYVYLRDSNNSNTTYYTISEFRTNGTKHYFKATRITGDDEDPFINFLDSDQCEDNQYPTLTYGEIWEGSPIFWCTHGTTTEAEISQALDDGKIPVLLYNGNLYIYCWATSGYRYFQTTINSSMSRIQMVQATSSWGPVANLACQTTSNKKSTPQTSAAYYPDFDYINNYEHQFKVTVNVNTPSVDQTFADITTAHSRGRQVIAEDQFGIVYMLAKIDSSEILFASNILASSGADITSRTVKITSAGVVTYWDNLGG